MMNPCDCCRRAEQRPDYARYQAGCKTCAVRELANGPLFHQSGLDGALSAPYRKALALVFGDAWRAGHEEVKAAAARIQEARAIL